MEIDDVHSHLDAISEKLAGTSYTDFNRSIEEIEGSKYVAENYTGRAVEILAILHETIPARPISSIVTVGLRAEGALNMLSELNNDERLETVRLAIEAMASSAEKARVVSWGVQPQLEQAIVHLSAASQMLEEAGMSLIASREHSMASADAKQTAITAINAYKGLI